MVALYEREARLTDSYERLVRRLIDRGRYEEAEQWAQEGIERTREKWPGIASNLAQRMAEVAEARKQWKLVAAHAAWQFFDRPSAETFKQLMKVAGKARCRTKVREQAMRFLETGRPPLQIQQQPKDGQSRATVDRDWPLPAPEHLMLLMRRRAEDHPRHDVLLEMALADKRISDVLHWSEQLAAREQRPRRGRRAWGVWGGASGYADRVAEAIAGSHPERSLAIYESQLEANLAEASLPAYEACASYLRRMRPILTKLGREREWKQRLEQIREDYRRRPRFMEVLDGIEGRTIVGSNKARGKRSKRR